MITAMSEELLQESLFFVRRLGYTNNSNQFLGNKKYARAADRR
jgi:hypothetical protein